ncbi:MAG: sulfite exporter TauE/SafE family protein [Flavobacteriales bacterium]|nr:sulfite exporter TauE/SafE family protein [Flavobacteriales bacterium]
MDLIIIAGYFLAIITGITLGITGGGGSILTVPVFAYLFSIEPITAISYSLFVVGVTSLVGAFKYMKLQLVSYRTAFVFAVPSFVTVYLTRRFLVPNIPDEILTISTWVLTKQVAILVFFGIITIVAALSMLKTKKPFVRNKEKVSLFNPIIALEGVGVGFVSGLVGAGGGFFIVPALVLLVGLPMRKAIGTSLLIISVKSLVGFAGDLSTDIIMDWQLLAIYSVLAIVGIFIGTSVAKYISSTKLKKVFGWFVLIMGSAILIKELGGSLL